MFACNLNDWNEKEVHKTMITNERYLPKIMVDTGVVKSAGEVRRNKPELCVELNDMDFIIIRCGKRFLWVAVGE